jgi:hypothetical protein
MCRSEIGKPPECDQTGNQPRCQLCPDSPTYWQNTAPPAAADPWNSTRTAPETPNHDHRPDWTHALDWGSHATKPGRIVGAARPCVVCGVPTTLQAPDHRHAHKVCAENYNRTYNPKKAASHADRLV